MTKITLGWRAALLSVAALSLPAIAEAQTPGQTPGQKPPTTAAAPRTKAQPGSEAAIRRSVTELSTGKPNYALMSPGLAQATVQQLPALQDIFKQLGALKTVRFIQVGPQGLDVYDVGFANGSLTWRILLDADGKTMSSGFSRNPATEEQRMAAFKANDKDKDGKLDKASYAKVLETLGFAAQLDQLFAQRDVNKDGFVSADEYKNPIPQ